MAATAPQALADPSLGPVEPSHDPISEFLIELDGLLRRWGVRTGGHWKEHIVYSLVEEEPEDGYRRQRRGPQAKVHLTITDTTQAEDLATARYPDDSPIDWPPAG